MAKSLPGQQSITEEMKSLWKRANIAQKREFADFCRRMAFKKVRKACASVSGIPLERDRQSS